LNPKIEDMEAFAEKTKEIGDIYLHASEMEGVHVYSTDEKMGVQAREHKNPSIPMETGRPERIDPEYIRHGTSGIIASRNVATGEITEPMVQPTRTEEDFARHIGNIIKLNSADKHIFILDNLNTHKSEALVRLVAEMEGIPQSGLGTKDKKGILKNQMSRELFLTDNEHAIRFVYTPKHCSWLNQIECWFAIITRRLLNRRSSFSSVIDLEQKIHSFIDHYNRFLAKPFNWNYKGKLLKV
jgi:transposase